MFPNRSKNKPEETEIPKNSMGTRKLCTRNPVSTDIASSYLRTEELLYFSIRGNAWQIYEFGNSGELLKMFVILPPLLQFP